MKKRLLAVFASVALLGAVFMTTAQAADYPPASPTAQPNNGGTGGNNLANTGGVSSMPIVAGVALLVVGGVTILLTRRRSTH